MNRFYIEMLCSVSVDSNNEIESTRPDMLSDRPYLPFCRIVLRSVNRNGNTVGTFELDLVRAVFTQQYAISALAFEDAIDVIRLDRKSVV